MYEHKTYVEARRRFPREGKALRTSLGEEKVVGVDILRETVTLRSAEGELRTVSLAELKGEVSAKPE
jgi:cell fate regulator YaaT (PSP1 superfamily)